MSSTGFSDPRTESIQVQLEVSPAQPFAFASTSSSSSASSSSAAFNSNLSSSSSYASSSNNLSEILRPRILLSSKILQRAAIGSGDAILLKLLDVVPAEQEQGEGGPSTLLAPKRSPLRKEWIAGTAWRLDREEDGTAETGFSSPARGGGKAVAKNERIRQEDGILPRCLLPAGYTGSSVKAQLCLSSRSTSKPKPPAPASQVELRIEEQIGKSLKLDRHTRQILSLMVKEAIVELGYVTSGQVLSMPIQNSLVCLRVKGCSQANSVPELVAVGRDTNVKIVSRGKTPEEKPASAHSPMNGISQTSITSTQGPQPGSTSRLGGLEEETKQLRELVILPLTRPDLFAAHGLQPPRGVLLHGPPGTGKTSLALSICTSFLPPSSIFTISGPELSSSYHGGTEARIRNVFRRARRKEMAVIIMDEIDVIAGDREKEGNDGVASRVVATLLTEIDGVGQAFRKGGKQRKRNGQGSRRERMDSEGSGSESGSDSDHGGGGSSEDGSGPSSSSANRGTGRVVVVAATNRPNVIDAALRRPGRLDREIEIGVPSPSARVEILATLLSATPKSITDKELEEVAAQTHGFVGADLSALVREAGMRVIRRRLAREEAERRSIFVDPTQATTLTTAVNGSTSNGTVHPSDLLALTDLLTVLPLIRPSSLRSFLPPPPLPWSSIALGPATSPYSLVRDALIQTVQWPLQYPDRLRKLGLSGNTGRGVLLYGPPGCSKTMIARACAQSFTVSRNHKGSRSAASASSSINWISIKGSELYSSYLGETERLIRELFRKARAAAPTILFIDEIDALTTTRSTTSATENAVGDRVITTLLTELDGVNPSSSSGAAAAAAAAGERGGAGGGGVGDGVILIGTTNRPQLLDPALLRPGRIDTHLYVPLPDFSTREAIFTLALEGMATDPTTCGPDVEAMARQTHGCSGAECVNLVKKAALAALKDHMASTTTISSSPAVEEEGRGGNREELEFIPNVYFERAAREVRRGVGIEVVRGLEEWAKGVASE